MTACRACGGDLARTFVDLGSTPLANSYLEPSQLQQDEPRYPLHARVCERCHLVQVDPVVPRDEIFRDYAYFSSYSASWVEHARRFAEDALRELHLTGDSLVVEIASNDGYLLKHFAARGIPVLGIEPALNVAKVAMEAGIPTETVFFGVETARQLGGRGLSADLLVANNVIAHVPDLNDFVAAMAMILKPEGVLSIEFPSLLRLIAGVQFDTIYHEHFSYFSLLTAERALATHGLVVFDVEELGTHGGSLRVWASRGDHPRSASRRLIEARQAERDAAMDKSDTYSGFQERAESCRRSLLQFFADARRSGKTIVGYGAAAKGNTLLNYCGITSDDIAYVVDRNPHKQGRVLPGTHVPIEAPYRVRHTRPEYLLILPWNLRDEIMEQMAYIRDWGGTFVTPVPEVQFFT